MRLTIFLSVNLLINSTINDRYRLIKKRKIGGPVGLEPKTDLL
jgi:hypothetical protein